MLLQHESTLFCMRIRDDGGTLRPGVAPLPPSPSPPPGPPPPHPSPHPPPPSPTPPGPAPAPHRTQKARWGAQRTAHGPDVVVSGDLSVARWPTEPVKLPRPNGRGCGQYVRTSAPVRSFWAVVPYGKTVSGVFLISVGFCQPELDFSVLV